MNNLYYSIDESSGKTGEICTLTNSNFYFVNSVFIININGIYRLVAKHNGKILMDKPYKTLRGAKIAFSKFFNHRSWKEDLHAEWSFFYKPDSHWLEEKSTGKRSQQRN